MAGPASLPPILTQLAAALAAKLKVELGLLLGVLFKPGSSFSVYSLAAAFLIATAAMMLQRRARGRRWNLKLIPRAMFPRRILRSASTRSDLGFFMLNLFALGGLIGWGLLSYSTVAHWTAGELTGLFGQRSPVPLNPWLVRGLLTLALFLAYEFAYWLDHWLAHTVPVLWEFHRVHHTAETLTPLTVFRVHPVDTLKFFNILAIVTGLVGGAGGYLAGRLTDDINLDGSNLILLGFIFVTVHLQHSHVWIAFTGRWGRVFASPAHHQIHHSADPAHFGKNLGSCLAVYDWLFGTLRIPAKAREPIVYGVEAGEEAPHTITGGLITPFVRALESLAPKPAKAPPAILPAE
ncbi:sterol desaturase family protein [Phenylobacterium montanum]|uniref:Sterol desaturase family protein n=1 Tax=Phenylobacterium montanum TaxID=2823693 RepID=A0A975IXC2_9CAUL|nr:sterol desaturase family protein [Caulobacter sp. S6]QUD90479.1 sterol desaturase family protein [Caulobacter sp. S6]